MVDVLVFVNPETVIRWQPGRLPKYWTWVSRRQHTGRPSVSAGLRELILRMAAENPPGALRAHSREARLLGIAISERTVSRYSSRQRPAPGATRERGSSSPQPPRRRSRAMDFFTVRMPLSVSLRLVGRSRQRRVLPFDVTHRPRPQGCPASCATKLPFTIPPYAIPDLRQRRDLHAGYSQRLNAIGLRPTSRPTEPLGRTAAERWVGSVRSELLEVAPSSSTKRHLRHCSESTLHIPRRTARTTRLRRRLMAVASPRFRKLLVPSCASRRLGGWHHRSNGAGERAMSFGEQKPVGIGGLMTVRFQWNAS